MPQRPFLTAAWRHLILLNFLVPTEVIKRLAPPGTEPDTHDGQSYISIVGFQFENVRVLGVPIPGHTNFPEINLRYYVRRIACGELRRGVVFVREIVPRRAVAILANRLYNENYVTRPMTSELQLAGQSLAPDDRITYTWSNAKRNRSPLPDREGQGEGSASSPRSAIATNRISAQVNAPLALPTPGSLEEFIVEHYWGYTHGRDDHTREYRVAHIPWRVAPAIDITWDCDLSNNYDEPFAEFLRVSPTSAIIAEGSPIQVFRGTRC